MPKFDLPEPGRRRPRDVPARRDLPVVEPRAYKILDILVGDPKAGEAFFNGAGRCSSCHSPAGDLKGVGAKYETGRRCRGAC